MADPNEEQEMEAEALEAIFGDNFVVIESEPLQKWAVRVFPETGDENSDENHVGCELLVTLPKHYPESSPPNLQIKILKGLADEHRVLLEERASAEAVANESIPCIFAVAETVREWLVENNEKGLDDVSMHAQMMRKRQEESKAKIKTEAFYEAQNEKLDMTKAEMEEMVVRKRRAEGTACNLETFTKWNREYDAEMAAVVDESIQGQDKGSKNVSGSDTVRKTGFQFFSEKSVNFEALEAAAEQAEAELDEDLFEEDVDVDDLSFDDEED